VHADHHLEESEGLISTAGRQFLWHPGSSCLHHQEGEEGVKARANLDEGPEVSGQVSMDFMSPEHGVPHDGPKDSNAGGCTREILDRNETR
jgi:hypothetical protein